ncbi:MAG: hypothetical protein Ct9H300mP14_02640 [Gammaproteobacteria bacterium]|nr:MAG: hypothetical protein Ct9H300mP14_02640 [Gammaproteobacteria bacterium]
MTDIGGKVPGSLPTDAAQVFEEGIQIPPVKIIRKGELNTEILELILRNCRFLIGIALILMPLSLH